MSPPTEQLIRDYINRLSVAAQGRLSREDRRALMDRTRGYIEHSTGLSGPPTAVEVAAVLSRLGAPAHVVAREVQRLAELRGDNGTPPPARIGRLARVRRGEPGRLSASWHWPARPGSLTELQAMLTGSRSDATHSGAADSGATSAGVKDAGGPDAQPGDKALRGAPAEAAGTGSAGTGSAGTGSAGAEPARAAAAGALASLIPAQSKPGSSAGLFSSQRPSWPHDPAIRRDEAQPGQAQQAGRDHAGGAPGDAETGTPRPVVAGGPGTAGSASATGQPDARASGHAGAGDSDGWTAPRGRDYADDGAARSGDDARESDETGSDDIRDEFEAGEIVADDTGELTAVDLAAVDPAVSEAPLLARVRRLAAAVIGWSRDKPLESVATILLGLGGLIFPPIWLLGAMVAIASKVWDYRDKWLGLALPILLTVVGTAAGVILNGSQSSLGYDVHVGWLSADIASRIAAVLGTAYLAWRSVHGRRPEAVPPWNKPHRVG